MTNAETRVGEYVRSNTGYISKLVKKHNEENRYAEMWQFETTITQRYGQCSNYLMPIYDEAKSHSFNIIDLIEVGDYVNGELVDETSNGTLGIISIDEFIPIDKAKIKSIVTKEQFKSMEYKVGGEE